MHPDYRYIVGAIRTVLEWMGRRWKAVSKGDLTRNGGIFRQKNRWTVPATRSVYRNRCIEIHKSA